MPNARTKLVARWRSRCLLWTAAARVIIALGVERRVFVTLGVEPRVRFCNPRRRLNREMPRAEYSVSGRRRREGAP